MSPPFSSIRVPFTHPLTSHHTFTLTSFLLAGFHLMPLPLVCLTLFINTQPLLTALTFLLKHFPSILHLASSASKVLESRNLPWYFLHPCVYKQVRLPLKNGGTKLRVLKRGYWKKVFGWLSVVEQEDDISYCIQPQLKCSCLDSIICFVLLMNMNSLYFRVSNWSTCRSMSHPIYLHVHSLSKRT